jgi:hypothetical protein
MTTVMLETPDAPEKVAAFYKEKMPKADRTDDQQEGKPIIRLSEEYGGNGIRMVEISEAGGKTRITLQNVRPTKTQEDLSLPNPPGGIGTPGINPAGSSSTP